jgi:uncharacterized protein DUF6090
MIKFFRKIRQNLLEEGNTVKYFKYAIGEIVLVIVGILIALQINNWNENKNNRIQAEKYLTTIKLNLEDDIKQAENLISFSKTGIEHSNVFLSQFKTLKPIDKNVQLYIVYLMLEQTIEVNNSGFRALLNSKGMTYINDNLQIKILNYYRHIEQLKSREEIANTDIKTLYEPYVKENYNWIYNKTNPWPRQAEFYKDDPRVLKNIDAKKLLADKQLEIMIYGRRWQSMNLHDLYNKTIVLATEIISDIENNKG